MDVQECRGMEAVWAMGEVVLYLRAGGLRVRGSCSVIRVNAVSLYSLTLEIAKSCLIDQKT